MHSDFKFIFFLIALLTSCNTSLPEEQRKALREEMEQREIKKVNENEIFRKALQMGRQIAASMDSVDIHKLESLQEVKIRLVDLSNPMSLNETEKKVLMAYSYAPDPTRVEDNIQKQGLDTLIYSTFGSSSTDTLRQILFIKMPRKKVVLDL